jgi:hypothetical protein
MTPPPANVKRLEHYQVRGDTARVTVADHEGVYQFDVPTGGMSVERLSEQLATYHYGEYPKQLQPIGVAYRTRAFEEE